MSERIGKVWIDDTDYPGRDLYSDGAVEDELLEIARTKKSGDFDRVVAERKSWPVLYHFSSVRQNILSWYPVSADDKILEIGAGCGAVTAALASRLSRATDRDDRTASEADGGALGDGGVTREADGGVPGDDRAASEAGGGALGNGGAASEAGGGAPGDDRATSETDGDAAGDGGAEQCGTVTCVDLSKKRSLVNAWRNRDCENLEIRLGNFQDVEKRLDNDYTIITLIGVFEYASSYIDSAEPYEDFLRIVARHLAPGGVILIAIENRLGMKYFAGCREDHTGRYFDGIENYPESDYAKTFSKAELEEVIRRAGLFADSFRYPYPDYKFPMAIYSDDYLPKKGELRNNLVNFDRKRMLLFDEARAFDSLVDAGEYPLFSNSFFVEVRKNGEKKNDGSGTAAFYKFSNDRNPAYQIRTDVFPGRCVRKSALLPAGTAHIRRMKENEGRLRAIFENTKFAVNRCELDGGSAVFEYLAGETLEEHFDAVRDDADALCAAFREFFGELDKVACVEHVKTDEFAQIFGDLLPDGTYRAAAVTDVDLLLNNIVAADGKWNVIDYEWTFAFTVPVDFVKWRVIHYYAEGAGRRGIVDKNRLFDEAGLSRADLPRFMEMEAHFQDFIAEGATPLWKLYPDISEGVVRVGEDAGNGTASGTNTAVVYFDRGAGFSESDTLRLRIPEDGLVRAEIPVEGVKGVRLDPSEEPASVELLELYADNRELDRANLFTNGFTGDRKTYIFPGEDPQIIVGSLPEGTKMLAVTFRVRGDGRHFRSSASDVLTEKDEQIHHLMQRLQSTEQTVEAMKRAVEAVKGTKAIRAYRSARENLKKSDPFEPIRPLLVNHRELHLTLDRRSYQPEGIHLMGWIYDPQYLGECLRVLDGARRAMDVKIERNRRKDVDASLGITDGRLAGFHILIRYDQLGSLPLALEVENPRGILRATLDIEPDAAKRRAARAARDVLLPVAQEYDDWAMDHEKTAAEREAERHAHFAYEPKISVIVPLYRTPETYLRELLDSLLGQTYRNLEICLADGSTDAGLQSFIEKTYGRDERIRYRHLDRNGGISENTNAAIAMASGDVFLFADHDDTLDISACYEIVRAMNAGTDVDVVYTDEDKLTAEGHFLYDPNFKPDFNPDYLMTSNYICHIFAVRREVAEAAAEMQTARREVVEAAAKMQTTRREVAEAAAGSTEQAEARFFRSEFDGAQDYDFILRCCEHARRIAHVPQSLYHWRAHPASTAGRPESKLYAYENGRRAVEEHFARTGVRARVTETERLGHYRVSYEVEGEPLVSILIPNRDQPEMLRRAVNSILARSTWRNFEILILENGSRDEATRALYRELTAADSRVRIEEWDKPFSFAAINNFGAERAKGEYLLFLNNDTEVVTPEWIEELLGFCQRANTGCAGAYLAYPDGRIQHAGVILGMGGAAGHQFGGMNPEDFPGGGRALSAQDLSAVTGACMMTKTALFKELGGFDEALAIAYNDIDYCLKVRERGLLVVYNPGAKLIHDESVSRGSDGAENPDKHERFLREAAYLREKWPSYFENGDPYYNCNLTLERPDYSLRS